jgi:hypothetical protein
MARITDEKYRSDRANEIRQFGDELLKLKKIKDIAPFTRAYNQCKNGNQVSGYEGDMKTKWGYELNNLNFQFTKADSPRKPKPDKCAVSSVSLNLKVVGIVPQDATLNDPFLHLEFNVIVKGLSQTKDSLVSSWHLDRHITDDNSNDPTDIHPIYHFQYGGRNLKHDDNSEFFYGSNLILGSPRLAHPPLEGILGLDFLFSNFFGANRKLFCQSRIYNKLVKNSQEIFWSPYLFSITTHWPHLNNLACNWKPNEIIPQLI